jgi:Uma2 family endonuclease
LHDKVCDFLDAGTRMVWVLEPSRRTVMVYRSRDDIRLLAEDDELEGGDVLPGFSVQVAELFGG